jgi:hypothetical protein
LNPLGLFITHLHTIYMAYSECIPTRLNPPAERTCFSQVQLFASNNPDADVTWRVELRAGSDNTGKVKVTGLAPGTTYDFQVSDRSGTFRTPPAPDSGDGGVARDKSDCHFRKTATE